MESYSNIEKTAICKPCPDYKGGKGQCVYPHEKGKPVGPGTGWPKKPQSGQTCEQLAQQLASHGKAKTAQEEMPHSEDSIILNVPLFIRLLEWAREEVKEDVPLHEIAEAAVKLGRPLSMEDYGTLLQETTQEIPVSKEEMFEESGNSEAY